MVAASRALSASVALALVLTAVWLFWPKTLGGGTTYVVTSGDSMAPEFHGGDLAILRAAGGYAVGDVVAYRSEALDSIVMHRIVSGDASGFVLQGDNNDWLDGEEPPHDEILGRLFLRVPRGGIALGAVASPGALVFLVGGLLAVLANGHRPSGRRDPRSAGRRRAVRRVPTFSLPTRSLARQVALGSGAVCLVALLAGAVLLVLPSTRTDTRTLQVTQQGSFTYTGAAERGTTYPSGVIQAGDTVWAKLAKQVTFSFTNTVIGPELTDVRGTMRLDVSVTASDGWSAVVASGHPVPLDSGTGTAAVTVEPSAAAALLSRHYAEVGGVGGGATLAVTPVVDLTGRIAGRIFTADPPAGLPFILEAASLRPSGDVASMEAISQTAVEVEEVAPRTIPVLSLDVPIDDARLAAAAMFGVALLVLGAGAWIGRVGRGDVADQFLIRHAGRILSVQAFTPGPTVFDVADAESLHRVAERFDTVVLHHAGPDEDVFAVRDADATYRFVIPGTPERRRGKPPVPGGAVRSDAPPAAASAHTEGAAPLPPALPAPDPTVPLPRTTDAPRDAPSSVPEIVAIARRTGRHWGRVA